MQYKPLGNTFDASRLTLGGGGIGQVWGKTDREEAIATVNLALESGINCFDMAPMYGDGEAEKVIGITFGGNYPDNIHLTTKYMLGDTPADQVSQRLTNSLDESCERMQRDFIDVFILHGYVIADGWTDSVRPKLLPHIAVPYSRFQDVVAPAFEQLKKDGRIGAWGITAASTQQQNLDVIAAERAPDVIQCITNVLDSPGSMAISHETPAPREIISAAQARNIGVMGIRAVAAGALTDKIDRDVKASSAEMKDFQRSAGLRELAAEHGVSTSFLAHQYAMSMVGVDTVVLGVKNRTELKECLAAEAAMPMATEVLQIIASLY